MRNSSRNSCENCIRNLWKNSMRNFWNTFHLKRNLLSQYTRNILAIYSGRIFIQNICENSKMNSERNCITICRNSIPSKEVRMWFLEEPRKVCLRTFPGWILKRNPEKIQNKLIEQSRIELMGKSCRKSGRESRRNKKTCGEILEGPFWSNCGSNPQWNF